MRRALTGNLRQIFNSERLRDVLIDEVADPGNTLPVPGSYVAFAGPLDISRVFPAQVGGKGDPQRLREDTAGGCFIFKHAQCHLTNTCNEPFAGNRMIANRQSWHFLFEIPSASSLIFV